jgi:hypothetical protein
MGAIQGIVARSPALLRGAAVAVLCAATAWVQMSDFRYETLRASLVPAAFVPQAGVSRGGVGVFGDDPSSLRLSRTPGRRVPFLARDIPNFRQVPAVRIAIEARAHDIVPGKEFWQSARVLLWSYGSDGRRLRYMPSEVLRLSGTKDWTRESLVVPVMPETVGMRLVIIQAGLAGSIAVRGVSVDGVGETRAYLVARDTLIALWLAAAVWVLVPMFRRFTRAHAAVAALLVPTLVGAFAPQPELTNTLLDGAAVAGRAVAPARHALARWISPPPTEVDPAPIVTLEPTIGSEPAEAQPAPSRPPSEAPSVPRAGVPRLNPQPTPPASLVADFTPRPDVKWGHFLAFAALAGALAFAFPATPRRHVFLALILFGISIEIVQGFSITRSPEPSDVVRDGLGAAVGLISAISWQFFGRFRRTGAG